MSDLVYPATPKYFCSFPVEGDFPVEVFKAESGREQRVADGSEEEIAYTLSYPHLTDADAATLKAFHRTHGGSFDSFLFDAIEPGGVVRRRVRFAAGGFKLVHKHNSSSGRKWALTVDLVKVVA